MASSVAVTASTAAATAAVRSALAAPPNRAGSQRRWNSATRSATRPGWLLRVRSMYVWLNANPIWRRYLPYARTQRDLPDAQAGEQHEAVEAVALDPTVDELDERVLQRGAPRLVEIGARRDADADVVDVHALGRQPERVRPFVERLQTEVVEQRQQLGQCGRRATPVHAEAPLARRRVDVAPERCRQVAARGEQVGDAPDVADGPVRADGRDVRDRCVGADGLEQRAGALLPHLGHERGPQAVRPRRRQLVDRPLEGVEIDDPAAFGAADADRDARQRAGADIGLERPAVRLVGVGDRVGDLVRQLRREPATRQVHEHRDPRPDGLGDLERPDQLALLEPDDRCDEPRQGRRLELEDEVARQVLEDGARRPPGVGVHPRRAEVEGVGDRGADARDVEHADAVGVRRQQTDEPGLHRALDAGAAPVPAADRSTATTVWRSPRKTVDTSSVRAIDTAPPYGIGRGAPARSSSRARPSSLPSRSVSSPFGATS